MTQISTKAANLIVLLQSEIKHKKGFGRKRFQFHYIKLLRQCQKSGKSSDAGEIGSPSRIRSLQGEQK